MIKIDIVTLFPKMFDGPFSESMVKRAQAKGLVQIEVHNLREWTRDKRKTVDDRPYGGGAGMVMMVEPVAIALESLKEKGSRVILMDPVGARFTEEKAVQLSTADHLVILCGHYEGVDQRIKDYLVDEIVSVGDYVLTGGELPAMVLTDAVVRLIPGVLNEKSVSEESFSSGGLEYPQYTRPEDFRGWAVPGLLLSGDHERIKKWRLDQSKLETAKRRPDLMSKK